MTPADVQGKTVVITGTFKELKRADAEAAITAMGAQLSGSVSKKTDMLFAGEKAGSKLTKAQTLGVPVYDEAALIALINAAPAPNAPEPQAAPAPAPAPAATQATAAPAAPTSAFSGKTIVCTGTFVTMKRADAEQLLSEAGATISGSVSKNTDLVIYGDNAGSKLTKAQTLNVALMTELEMVQALNSAGGQASDKLADADKVLAAAAADKAKNETETTRAVQALRDFLVTLKKRKDIRVKTAKLGRKASKSDVDFVRTLHIELAEFYAEMNGVHIEWSFIEPEGGGCIRIPEISRWTEFTTDDDHYMGFGDDTEALLLDEITAEGNTWLVRKRTKKKTKQAAQSAQIIFASAAEGADGVIAAKSIAEYINKAIDNAFAYYWPCCFKPSPYVSYADQEEIITRFKAGPTKPSKFTVDDRIQFSFFSEGGRGKLLSIFHAPESNETQFTGQEMLLISMDEGTTGWFPARWCKVLKKQDAYEQLRAKAAPLDPTAEGLEALIDDVARAIGPLESFGSHGASNSRRAAGLLAELSLQAAIDAVIGFEEALHKAPLDLQANRPIAQNNEIFNKIDFARFRDVYTIDMLITGLYGGLAILARHASATNNVKAKTLATKAQLKALKSEQRKGQALAKLLSEDAVLSAPSYYHSTTAIPFPTPAPLFQGTGY